MQQPLAGKHILIIVENLPLPFDRRVWQEANSLKEGGAYVSIICPKMDGYNKKFEQINGIDIYRHPIIEAQGAMGYFLEYTVSLFWEFYYSAKIYSKKRYHVIQGCNPPDLIFLVALFYKMFRVKYVFDHHDINPELYIAKYNKKGIFYNFLLLAEKLTFKTADYSIATNESYKKIAIERGKMLPEKVEVIRSGPKLDRIKIQSAISTYRKGKDYLVGYVGVIGEQEGIDLLLKSIQYIVRKRSNVQFAIVGGGSELNKLKSIATDMKLNSFVDFYGRVDDNTLLEVLNTADVCVNPDRPTEMNNLSTMNKIMEYMALGKPIVQYDLKEGRASALDASLYAENINTDDFGEKILWLIDNQDERKTMGQSGYNRILKELSWEFESIKLVNFYKHIFLA